MPFIPVDQAKANALREQFKSTFFNSPEHFVQGLNSGFFNTSDKTVKALLDAITENFKDVQQVGRKVIFLSESEVYLSEALERLEQWSVITRFKREVVAAVESGDLDRDAELYLQEDGNFVDVEHIRDDDGDIHTQYNQNSILGKVKGSDLVVITSVPGVQNNGDVYVLPVAEVLSIKDDFIPQVASAIPSVSGR